MNIPRQYVRLRNGTTVEILAVLKRETFNRTTHEHTLAEPIIRCLLPSGVVKNYFVHDLYADGGREEVLHRVNLVRYQTKRKTP